MNDMCNLGHLLRDPVEMSDLAASSVPLAAATGASTATGGGIHPASAAPLADPALGQSAA